MRRRPAVAAVTAARYWAVRIGDRTIPVTDWVVFEDGTVAALLVQETSGPRVVRPSEVEGWEFSAGWFLKEARALHRAAYGDDE